ncbi:MAG: polysaccharide deacetylase family protein [Peptoniphilus sp.]|nr:polysaccharide deacetylase family protein [Peptoniphilus sp.]MDD7362712.1 polysaccharide deacetylase family protein [Bacillota bacterium]MDY6044594.1 polysaccharide deacetylase family protein [Peptoniphilus sp.]
MLRAVLIVAIAWALYSPLPTIYFKFLRKENYEPGTLEFTFDDGPNPEFTPRLLSLLEENGVRATFFVVGQKAERYPDLVKRERATGHTIGLHCYDHTHPLFWGPIKTARDMDRAQAALESLGITPIYYRPPHGWVNLTMLRKVRSRGMRLKLWTAIPGDWDEHMSVDQLYEAIAEVARTGGVVCLHDSNHRMDSPSRAPLTTLEALERYFETR